MVTVAEQHQSQHRDQDEKDGGDNTEKRRGVTIRSIDEDSGVDNPSERSAEASSSFQEDSGGYGTDAVCAKTQPGAEVQRLDEDARHSSSTQYSDVESLDCDESGSWSNDLNIPTAVEQHFDNGVALPNNEVPSFGDVRVKNSANVHFGNKTFYNGPVTIKQIVYANPIASDNGFDEDSLNYTADKVLRGAQNFARNGSSRISARTPTKPVDSKTAEGNRKEMQKDSRYGILRIFSSLAETEEMTRYHRLLLLLLSLLAISLSVSQFCAWLLTWRCIALMSALGSCLVAAVVVSVVLLSRESESPLNPVFPQIPDSSVDPNALPLGKLRFVERNEWGAQPPTEPLAKLNHPVPYVIISHTATDFCKTQAECTHRVRFAQTFHIESRNWSDIGYNFLVGGDGYAYVGRSWDFVGAHSYNYNTRSIGISFIGTFNSVIPPDRQLHAAQELIKLGVKMGKIATDYKLLGHRQISETVSPGDGLYNVLKTWPHWSPAP